MNSRAFSNVFVDAEDNVDQNTDFRAILSCNIPIPKRKSKIHRIHNLTISRSSENHERMYKLL